MPDPTPDENTLNVTPAATAAPAAPAATATPAAPAATAAPPPAPAAPVTTLPRPAPRTRTMVYGLILLVVAGCVLFTQLTGAHLDAGAVALTVMVIAGLLLIVGGRRNSG